jgi:NitT/TauT family transport system permease protein
LLLPPPIEVLEALVEYAEPIAEAAFITSIEILLGFAVAVLGGFAIALPIRYSRGLRSAIYPPLLLLNAVPKAAIAPILLIWFGFGITHKVMVTFLVAFFPIVIALNAGLRSVDPDLHDLSRSLHASWFQTFRKIDLPFALPSLFSGLRVAITLAVVGAVIAEFVAGDAGLANLLRRAGAQNQTALTFACAMVLSVLSTCLFGAVVLAEHLAIPWARRSP